MIEQLRSLDYRLSMRSKAFNRKLVSYMKKSYIISCFILGITILCYIFATSKPEYLAANYERVPDFFSFPAFEFNYSNSSVCVDELHSQGRKFEDFGTAFYKLRITKQQPQLKKILSEYKDFVKTDSSYIITKRRGNIKGIFTFMLNSSVAYVYYEQIYEDSK